ncbi:uncharacterized protein LOC142981271 [Anticarsia gemmatalis]|uniref:uncharacterized protein LOC142981271 n=1 Tax=Anticarsia gemmatalis TaxID=129554 RepID=UPI003F7768FD
MCQCRKYDNFTLFSTVPTEPDHLRFLQNLDQQKYIDLVFWKKPYKLYEDVQFIVNPVDKELFIERANHYKLKTVLLLKNIQSAFDDQEVKRYSRLKVDTYSWQNYHSLEDIYQWLADMALKYPTVVELTSIGKSVEGREIFAISVKKNSPKFRVIVECGTHGHEWISVQFATYLVDQLVRVNVTKNWKLARLIKKYEWYVIPIVNPDGYVYSQKTDRLWRKNRRLIGSNYGVDLNRNFDYNFGKYGTSNNEKDDYYCGPHPFSEPESKILAEFITQKKQNLKFYFSFHAYGQKIIIPYADRIKHIDNYGETENFGKQAILKMYSINGVKYSIGTTYDTLGLRISGNSASYTKKTHNVSSHESSSRFVYTFLLRDNGSYGYALPPSQILPTCKETLSGIMELMTAKHRKMNTNVFFYLITLSYFKNVCVSKNYENYTLYRAIPVNESHLEFILFLDEFFDVIYWREPSILYKPVDFVINPNDEVLFLQHANQLGVYLTTVMENVQSAFNEQTAASKSYVRRKMASMDWTSFYRLDDVYDWLMDLARTYPRQITIRSIGDTYERRNILSVRVLLSGATPRSTVIIEGGIHAREWISPAVVTYLISQLLHARSSGDSTLKSIAETYEFYFIPFTNPDGYEYTHTTDRLWRKNRNSAACVDLNRNFATAFGTAGISWSKTSEKYCGAQAFSELESKAMADFIQSKSSNLEYYISFHSYGQYMVIPYAYSKQHFENYDEVYVMSKEMAKKISMKYQTRYAIGSAYETVGYIASGLSSDWVKKTFKVPFVLTLELRDTGHYGFALPPSQILPTCIETLDGIVSFLTPRGNITKLGGNMSNDPDNRLAVTTNRHITCSTIIYIETNIQYIKILHNFYK